MSVCDSVSVVSDLDQLDGNVSVCSNTDTRENIAPDTNYRVHNASVANHLPVVTVCNMRSFFPKLENFKTYVDISLLCEVWQKAEDKRHMNEIESMLEMDGLKYFSTMRPKGKRGGGAAIIANQEKFQVEKLDIHIPHKLEIIWALAKPKAESAQFKHIILCSFYSPPRSRLRNRLKDHMVGTLQMLTMKYPGCGILVGRDKNKMNISSLLNNNLKLKQVVSSPTRKKEILDIVLTN